MRRSDVPTSEVGTSDWVSNIPLPSLRIPTGTMAGKKEEGSVEGNRARQLHCGDPIALNLSTVYVLLVCPRKPQAHGSRSEPEQKEYHSQADGDVELGRRVTPDASVLSSYCSCQSLKFSTWAAGK